MYTYIRIYIDMNVGVQSFLLVKKPQNQGHVANPAKIKETKFQQHNQKSLFERQDRKCKISRKVVGSQWVLYEFTRCIMMFYIVLSFSGFFLGALLQMP